MSRGFGKDKSRAALAVSASTKITIEGDYEDDRIKSNNVANALGTVFNGNAIASMQVLDDIDDLQARVLLLEEWIANTFVVHTHEHEDDDGTDIINKTTTGVI